MKNVVNMVFNGSRSFLLSSPQTVTHLSIIDKNGYPSPLIIYYYLQLPETPVAPAIHAYAARVPNWYLMYWPRDARYVARFPVEARDSRS